MQKRTLYTLLPIGIEPHPPTYQTFENKNLIVGGKAIPRLASGPVEAIRVAHIRLGVLVPS